MLKKLIIPPQHYAEKAPSRLIQNVEYSHLLEHVHNCTHWQCLCTSQQNLKWWTRQSAEDLSVEDCLAGQRELLVYLLKSCADARQRSSIPVDNLILHSLSFHNQRGIVWFEDKLLLPRDWDWKVKQKWIRMSVTSGARDVVEEEILGFLMSARGIEWWIS